MAKQTVPPGDHQSSSPLPAHLRAGIAAEDDAARFLETQGLQVLERNVRVPGGEIDIVAREGTVLVFCEVRWRARSDFGGALASIDARKRARLWRAATRFLQRYAAPPACRLDALCADGPAPFRWIWIRGL